jgi:hypothetical protein
MLKKVVAVVVGFAVLAVGVVGLAAVANAIRGERVVIKRVSVPSPSPSPSPVVEQVVPGACSQALDAADETLKSAGVLFRTFAQVLGAVQRFDVARLAVLVGKIRFGVDRFKAEAQQYRQVRDTCRTYEVVV